MLQLRHQRIEIGHQNSQLNDRINAQQAKLWSQQLQIAVYTAPNAIQQTVNSHDLKMVSQSPVQRGTRTGSTWATTRTPSDDVPRGATRPAPQ